MSTTCSWLSLFLLQCALFRGEGGTIFKAVPFPLTSYPVCVARHVGDLGNVTAAADSVAKINIQDEILSLAGPHSIIGRTMVVRPCFSSVYLTYFLSSILFLMNTTTLKFSLHKHDPVCSLCPRSLFASLLPPIFIIRSMRRLMIWEKETTRRVGRLATLAVAWPVELLALPNKHTHTHPYWEP